MSDWTIIPQGCTAAPNLRTLIQGPGHQHVLLSSSIPAETRARLAALVVDELNGVESDKALMDWIQASPNPRLAQVASAWLNCVGGVSLRGTIRALREATP